MKEDNDLVAEVKQELNKINMVMDQIVFLNSGKGRISGIALYGEKKFFYKYNSKENQKHLELLQKEIKFYTQIGEAKNLPKVFYSSYNLIIMEYLSGKSLREVIKKDKMNDERIILKFWELVTTIQNKQIELEEEEKLDVVIESVLYRLLYSTPMQEKNYKLEKMVTHMIIGIMKKKFCDLKQFIYEIVTKDETLTRLGLLHGDLHLNNILFSKQELYLLDWENYRKGYGWLEVLFVYVQIVSLFCIEENEEQLLKFCKINDLNMKSIIKIKNIFILCIETNRSFVERTNIQWIKAEIKLLKSLFHFDDIKNKRNLTI